MFIDYLFICIAFAGTVFYYVPPSPKIMAVCAGALILVCGAAITAAKKAKKPVRFFSVCRYSPFAILPAISGWWDFTDRWAISGVIDSICRVIGMQHDTLVYLSAAVCALLTLLCANYLLCLYRNVKQKNAEQGKNEGLFRFIRFICVVLLQYISVEYSALISAESLLCGGIYTLLNLAVIACFDLLLMLIIQRSRIAIPIVSVFLLVWGVANYYVTRFHGSPLFPSELANAGTALDVATGYNYSISFNVVLTFLCFALQLPLIARLDKGRPGKARNLCRGGALAAAALAVYLCLFSWDVVPKGAVGWSWKSAVNEYGFVNCCIEDLRMYLNPCEKPEGYDAALLTPSDKTGALADYSDAPDIIMILNETFWDASMYTDIETDVDYMEAFYGIDGAAYGYALTPKSGGGTNSSEYEILTSNSCFLLSGSAPYNFLYFNADTDSAVKYLKSFGYSTMGLHSATASNYKRNVAYPSLGFDTVRLGEDSFSDINYYGTRFGLDSDDYMGMISLLEASGEAPRFAMLLTYQNHGGYEQNGPEYDTVHLNTDLVDRTDDLEEFLTSLRMSCEAFRDLTEYYKTSDRKVIICMFGDHATDFVNDLPFTGKLSGMDKNLAQRVVPYVIWSNCGAVTDDLCEYCTLTDLFPMVLKCAGLPLSDYYESVLTLQEKYPFRSSSGLYLDAEGNELSYDAESGGFEDMKLYYIAEYNNISHGSDYVAGYFEP